MYSSYTEAPEANGSKRKRQTAQHAEHRTPCRKRQTKTRYKRQTAESIYSYWKRRKRNSRLRKISGNRQIMTSWRHRIQIVINIRQFQNPVQPIFKSWRNRKRGTLYARTRKAPTWQVGNQQKHPDDHGKRPDRNSFQKSATILKKCGEGFLFRYFAETHRLYAPCPDCPDLCPYFYLRKPSGAIQHFPTFFQRFQRVEHIGADFSNALNALNARLKPPIPRLNAVFCRKTANLQH